MNTPPVIVARTGVARKSAAEVLGESIDDQDLVTGSRDGDRESQRKLYERHFRMVYRLMFRMVSGEHVDDLTQQVFLKVFSSIGQYRGRSKFSTWLYRLAANEALQFLRRQKCRHMERHAVEPTDCRPSEILRFDDRELLRTALAGLDPELRAVFLLRELEQQSYLEIALTLDIAEGTVASRLNRARKLLRDRIEKMQ